MELFDSLARPPELDAAVSRMANHDETDRGAIFTRHEVVNAILDLCGYCVDHPLHLMRLLEPAFGGGDFLLQIVERLLKSYELHGGRPARAGHDLAPAIRGVELHADTYRSTFSKLQDTLERWGMQRAAARTLCSAWLLHDDFLLTHLTTSFDFVVGNPPYVRQERIPAILLGEYRRRFSTLYDRADLYIPFFERSLDLLSENGTLGFICANRWMKNRYGGPLREKISRDFWLRYYMDTEGTDAFHADVIAYPAITVFQRRNRENRARHVTRTISANALAERPLEELATVLLAESAASPWVQQIELTDSGIAPLLLDDVAQLALMQRIEHDFPTLEQAGCKVGIGVATGCDEVYIGALDNLPVESSRKLPLAMARDLVDGRLCWGGKGVLNPFGEDGRLVELDSYPMLRSYLRRHEDAIRRRNVAKRNPSGWFRTIDRIYPHLQATPKLLVPDIKGEATFVLDEGHFYPHHNLYYVTSQSWDLRALQSVLRSSVTLMTVATYCTRMAGGFLRFQAQYLRKIRLPDWTKVDAATRKRLIETSASAVQDEVDAPVFELYGLTQDEAARVRSFAATARTTKGRTR
jgi:hypothetical protein